MKVLSLFDGISCARVALERAGIPVEEYYASEIDKYAIQISKKNYPDIVQLGGVVNLSVDGIVAQIDLLIGGSPCQDLSIAKAGRKGLDGARSGLFWEYVRILKEVKPRYFVLENVASMPKEAKQIITDAMGVEPIMIDAALVSAQRRKRLFWTNIPNVGQPEDRGILLKDILEDGDGISVSEQVVGRKRQPDGSWKRDFEPRDDGKSSALTSNMNRSLILKDKSNPIRLGGRGSGVGNKHDWDSVYQYRRTYWRETKGGKVPTLTANMGTGGNNVPYVAEPVALRNRGDGKKPEYNGTGKANALTTVQTDSMVDVPYVTNPKMLNFKGDTEKCMTITATAYKEPPLVHNSPHGIRKLTPIECERLQSLPDNYTEGVSNTQRYKCLGNAFNVEVVAHILKHI